MATININRNVTDMFYRYKMPKVIVKVEGKGNGIKTRIVNMSDIAKALDRPPAYPTKYFGCELGAQTTIDHKTDKYIVNGSHTADKMQDILDGFIQKFVLCPKCENPETTLTVHKQSISQRCMACGERGVLKIVHRLTQFIHKNPPTPSVPTENGKKDTKKTKGKKGGKKDSDSDEDKAQNNTNDSNIAQNYQDADRNGDQDTPPPVAEEWDDEEWAEESQQTTEIEQQLSNATLSSSTSDKSHEEKLETFYNFVENLKKEKNIATLHKDIFSEAERLEIVEKAPFVLTEVLLGEGILKELVSYRNIFLRCTLKNPRAQKNLLQSLEMLIGQRFPDTLLPRTAHVLKSLYDNDLVDEAVIIDWHKKGSKKILGKELAQQLHNKAAPFVTWLQEAEEESGSEEESDEDEEPEVEIEYSYQATSGLKEAKVTAAVADDDDLDIDNI